MSIIFYPLIIFIAYPFLAAVPCLVMAWLYRTSKKTYPLSAALLWLLYIPYEYAMKFRILCSGECNIRVDLLLIYPVLLFVTIAGCIIAAKAIRARRTAP